MTQTKHKYKPGDLVKHRDDYCQSVLGLGIIIATEQALLGPAYDIYWTKIGLDWHYEEFLKKII